MTLEKVETRLRELADATADLKPSPGFELRLLAKLRAKQTWADAIVTWWRFSAAIGLVLACVAIVMAARADALFFSEVSNASGRSLEGVEP